MTEAGKIDFSRKIIAGDNAILARRYANALYELAEEHQQLDAVASDLQGLRALLSESAEFQAVAFDPRLGRTKVVAIVKEIAGVAKLNATTTSFLGLLAKNRRLSLLVNIIDGYLDELSSRRGEFTADVRTAYPLSPQQSEKLAAQLQNIAGGKVHISVREDRSLLGGMVVKLGSQLIDVSVKGRLDRLERQLKSKTN